MLKLGFNWQCQLDMFVLIVLDLISQESCFDVAFVEMPKSLYSWCSSWSSRTCGIRGITGVEMSCSEVLVTLRSSKNRAWPGVTSAWWRSWRGARYVVAMMMKCHSSGSHLFALRIVKKLQVVRRRRSEAWTPCSSCVPRYLGNWTCRCGVIVGVGRRRASRAHPVEGRRVYYRRGIEVPHVYKWHITGWHLIKLVSIV